MTLGLTINLSASKSQVNSRELGPDSSLKGLSWAPTARKLDIITLFLFLKMLMGNSCKTRRIAGVSRGLWHSLMFTKAEGCGGVLSLRALAQMISSQMIYYFFRKLSKMMKNFWCIQLEKTTQTQLNKEMKAKSYISI